MHVLLICLEPHVPPWDEGMKNLTRRLGAYLERQGDEATIVSPDPPSGPRTIFGQWAFLAKVIDTARKVRPDVSLALLDINSSFGIRTWLLRMATGSPLVVYVPSVRRRRIGYKCRLSADSIVVCSPYVQEYLPDADIVYPFLRLDMEKAKRPALDLLSQSRARGMPLKVLFIGAYQRGRGIEFLLDATALALKEASIDLVIALNGYNDADVCQLVQIIDRLGIADNVTIKGVVDPVEAYSQCDVLVIPRTAERFIAFPLRIIEALHMGKPLIVTTLFGMGDLIDGCGIAVSPRDPREMAQAMVTMATSSDQYAEFVMNTERLLARYSPAKSLQKIRRVLYEAANR